MNTEEILWKKKMEKKMRKKNCFQVYQEVSEARIIGVVGVTV
jgi:hypothetical protein